MAETYLNHGLGWRPDLPSNQDYGELNESIPGRLKNRTDVRSLKELTEKLRLNPESIKKLNFDSDADLRPGCSPIEDQETIGSCTAHAVVGLIEYYERKAYGRHIDASRLFLYKTTRNLLGFEGDTGAYLRSTMAALALFGVPPEAAPLMVTFPVEQESTSTPALATGKGFAVTSIGPSTIAQPYLLMVVTVTVWEVLTVICFTPA